MEGAVSAGAVVKVDLDCCRMQQSNRRRSREPNHSRLARSNPFFGCLTRRDLLLRVSELLEKPLSAPGYVAKVEFGSPTTSRRIATLLPVLPVVSSVFSATSAAAETNSILRSMGIGDADIYYPVPFEGSWTCRSTLVSVDTPQGADKTDRKNVESARKQLGYTVTYSARFIPYKGSIIGDRLFTTMSLMEATVGKNLIEDASWEPEHPNRLSFVLRGGLKVENLVTKRSFEMSGSGQFDTSEYSKQVFDRMNEPGPPSIKASRNLTRYKWDPSESRLSTIEVFQRVSMYRVPGETFDYMDVYGMSKPVTVYKYLVQFTRAPESL